MLIGTISLGKMVKQLSSIGVLFVVILENCEAFRFSVQFPRQKFSVLQSSVLEKLSFFLPSNNFFNNKTPEKSEDDIMLDYLIEKPWRGDKVKVLNITYRLIFSLLKKRIQLNNLFIAFLGRK